MALQQVFTKQARALPIIGHVLTPSLCGERVASHAVQEPHHDHQRGCRNEAASSPLSPGTAAADYILELHHRSRRLLCLFTGSGKEQEQ